ncbi:MAG: TrkH family potassium uptake protein [Syntrophales bacterium]|nr:TrkH family potassium uptake protein [Syntrophales bacterium]
MTTDVRGSLTPARIFILSFATLIVAGAIFLWMPFAAAGERFSFVDALFMSASAVCVTGLATLDIGKDFTPAGQVVTLLLFQIGGLGIITFSVFLFAMMGRGIPFKGREIVQSSFFHTPRRDIISLLKWILTSTLLIEAVGTAILFIRFSGEAPWERALFQALYHAISAFNNCGYSLFSSSLMAYRDDWIINLTIVGLIILGGIGFIVQYELASYLTGTMRRLSLHTKIVLLMTTVLTLIGAILFYLFECHNILKNASWETAFLVSLFQSVTARTCGFNTVDIGALSNGAILVLMILMFIGASPGSTGGGIKTTSFALLVLIIGNRFQGREEVTVFHRSIPREILGRTMSIIFASALCVCIVTVALLLADPPTLDHNRQKFVEYLFETISAFGTVGLSMGVTTQLNPIQKLIVILMMFVGRVGPLTLAFALSTPKRGVVYAEESIMVG